VEEEEVVVVEEVVDDVMVFSRSEGAALIQLSLTHG
jgi:hypothetical protein